MSKTLCIKGPGCYRLYLVPHWSTALAGLIVLSKANLSSFTLTHDCVVGEFKEVIQSKRAPDTLKDVGPHALELWKPKDSNPIAATPADTLAKRIGSLGNRLSKFADKLEPTDSLFSIFSMQPPSDDVHIIVKAPATVDKYPRSSVIEQTAVKRKHDDPIDISDNLFYIWAIPVKQDLEHLKGYLEEPLDPDWKIPLSRVEWRKLLFRGVHDHACYDQDLELLFTQSEDETANEIQHDLKTAIMNGPLEPDGTDKSLSGFWDDNIQKKSSFHACLLRMFSVTARVKNLDSSDLALVSYSTTFVYFVAKKVAGPSRGSILKMNSKTRPDGCMIRPLIFSVGYYAIGVSVTIVAILPQGGSLRVVDLITADLSSRRERIKNATRMIKMCGILRSLQQTIGKGKDEDMFVNSLKGGKTIEYFLSHVRKTYGFAVRVEDRDAVDRKERVKHLQAIYASLVSKGVPNVDRLRKAEIQHCMRGTYVDLEPVGISEEPKTFLDVRNAVVCILEALKVAHADPPVFHRDIHWSNIMQSREDSSKWFLIDWEDASFAPTKAVYEDNHGAEVDIWAVGRLIFTAITAFTAGLPTRDLALEGLGERMMDGHVLNAEQGLKEICDLPQL
ncbi:hypothetical protein F5887DRAFT_1285964 [Amanita rubescens]|nr:hypothetical protein F5887DRAFT_1285964 [Amanita rubescens]